MEGGGMKRFLVVVVLSLLAAALLPTSAPATHNAASSGGPPISPPNGVDFIGGTGTAPLVTPCGNVSHSFGIGGSTTASGTTGNFWKFIPSIPCLGLTNIFFSGNITCLTAPGPTSATNDGYWVGLITFVWINGTVGGIPGLFFPGMGVRGGVMDNWVFSPPVKDREGELITPTPLPCNHPLILTTPTNAITSGNIVVHDGLAP
jgi:hypothetical protein